MQSGHFGAKSAAIVDATPRAESGAAEVARPGRPAQQGSSFMFVPLPARPLSKAQEVRAAFVERTPKRWIGKHAAALFGLQRLERG